MTDSGHTPAERSRVLVDQLIRSDRYREYARAFQEAVGLPLSLRPIEAIDLPHRDSPNENPFCALLSGSSRSCAACLQFQRKVEDAADLGPRTLHCHAGLCDSAVPVRVGSDLVAYLQTGQVRLDRPSRRQFSRVARQLRRWGADAKLPQMEEAYFGTRVLTPVQYDSILRLLAVFAQHLAGLARQLIERAAHAESPQIARARAFIDEHQSEDLTLGEVARSVNMSAFYFCKLFRHATGLTFTDYLAKIRVEKVKRLLLEPGRRISEAAYAAGFQSLSQFNRVFRKVAGEPPTAYRARIARTAAA